MADQSPLTTGRHETPGADVAPDPSLPPVEARLTSLAATIGATNTRGPAPVHLWHPPFCGDIAMRIAADGTWFYAGTPITRPAMVALFARVLRRDPERYVLVTPAECVGLIVEDAPFVAVAMAEADGLLRFITNMGDEVEAGPGHGLRFATDADGGVKPYVHVRGDLWARLTRSLAIELLDRAEERDGTFGVRSGAACFPLAPAEPAA